MLAPLAAAASSWDGCPKPCSGCRPNLLGGLPPNPDMGENIDKDSTPRLVLRWIRRGVKLFLGMDIGEDLVPEPCGAALKPYTVIGWERFAVDMFFCDQVIAVT